LIVAHDAAGSPQSISLLGNAIDLSITAPSGTAATVNAGQRATYNLQLAPDGGFSGLVTLSCSGAPQKAQCGVSPNALLVSGQAAGFVVTVDTTAPSTAALQDNVRHPSRHLSRALLAGSVPLWSIILVASWKSRRRGLLSVFVLVAIMAPFGCGGGNSSAPPPQFVPGTPTGTYNINLIAVSGTLNRPMTLSLTVK
jgi:hypothetical protein